jgi:DNA-binding transcriptional MerR regulator
MSQMVPIGRFSKMTRLSVKALRLYDEIGLLRPAWVDESSGYRYYEPGQANRAEAIRILRTVDMPLDEIGEVLDIEDPSDAKTALKRHHDRLMVRLADQRRMLEYLETIIDREKVMPYDIAVEQVLERTVAALRKATNLGTITDDIGAGFEALMRFMGVAGTQPVGAPFIVYWDIIDEETNGDIELCVPVTPGLASSEAIEVEMLPAEPVAWTIHHGPYQEISPAYHTLTGWISDHGHEMTGPPREIYLNDPTQVTEDELLTRVEWPINAEMTASR